MPELRRSTRVASQTIPAPIEPVEPVQKKSKKEPHAPKPEDDEDEEEEEEEEEETSELEVGDSIPEITLLDEDEKEVNLKTVASTHKYVVIFAYPKASTPGCTRQVCGFQKNYEFLSKSDVAVFGLSADQPKAQKNFVVKQKLDYQLLSDPSKELIGPLGAKKSPSGTKRSHWIFVDGVLKVKEIQISPEASIDGAKEHIERFIKEAEVKDEDKENK